MTSLQTYFDCLDLEALSRRAWLRRVLGKRYRVRNARRRERRRQGRRVTDSAYLNISAFGWPTTRRVRIPAAGHYFLSGMPSLVIKCPFPY